MKATWIFVILLTIAFFIFFAFGPQRLIQYIFIVVSFFFGFCLYLVNKVKFNCQTCNTKTVEIIDYNFENDTYKYRCKTCKNDYI